MVRGTVAVEAVVNEPRRVMLPVVTVLRAS